MTLTFFMESFCFILLPYKPTPPLRRAVEYGSEMHFRFTGSYEEDPNDSFSSFFWYKGPYDSKLLLNVAEFVEFMITRKGISDPLTSTVHIHQPENNLFLAHGTETESISNFPCSVSRLVFTVASNFKGLFFPCCNNIFRRTNQIK